MTVYVDPVGSVIPNPGRFDLGKNAHIIFGSSGSDMFFFRSNPWPKVVIGLGGGDTFNAAATPQEVEVRYYSYLRYKEWVIDGLGGGRPWEPWKSGNDIAHIGGGMDAKLGMGADKVFLHGGHYQTPAQVWVQPDDRVYMASPDVHDMDVIRFKTGQTHREGDHFTAALLEATVKVHTDNPITDGQMVTLKFTDQGTYYDRPGHNVFKQDYIDFAHKSGPTEHELLHHLDHWLA